ncbi:MAG: prolyl oligopeptidase family serine peptidase [Flavobacteriales bacterium]|jgi:dipeptidyl aminopeptidase/acylaminoacyl peptidase|uniref:alpha/beta hydrolase family protein n=1 Tax=Candidatus Ulvibacter alkanivorans TaxID=2267620 RepID=UPI000DF340C9|nr:prolyl oligopeptidase family serine peptidase [Candidatus Ulvibacter alkanivorans]MCH2490996.1 prolyl oligopeptidase family serine peptidase [Flavobacteriales bacterium]
MKKLLLLSVAFLLFFGSIFAQENLTYKKPPAEILELVDAPLAPSVQIDSKGNNVVLLYRDAFKSIEELSETEMRLGGLRINPKTNIGSRTNYYNNLKVKKATASEATQVKGLPTNPRLSNFRWAPNEKMIACLNTTATGVEVWIVDIENASAKKITPATVNANMGDALNWFQNSEALLVKMLPSNREALINASEAVPEGPTVSVSDGAKAQNRTYQDLLKNPNDEHNFEQLALSELKKVTINGTTSNFLPTAMYRGISFSPDGNYLLVSKLKKPFSYIVPYYRFPYEEAIYEKDGNLVTVFNDVPLNEVQPKGFMATRTGKRNVSWRSDKPSTIYWVEALDGGDPENEVTHRDVVYEVYAPFTGRGRELLKTKNRFSGITWGNDNVAIAYDYWWNDRNTKTYLFNPNDPGKEAVIITDRNYQDRYSDPGNFVTSKNDLGSYTLEINNGKAYLMGDGYSEKGQFPFIDEFDISTRKTKRLYESPYTDKLENLITAIDMDKGKVLVRIEAQNEYPNYYFRNINKKNSLTPVTAFDNPYQSLSNVHKEVITYKRDDGLELEGTLYLPIGYDKDSKEKKPMLLWAYPREFKDKSSASQNTTNPNEFIYPYWGSPIYWVTQGYVVLDDAAFPIVGEGDEEPNDSFREQLVANGKAAIDAVDALGYIDRNRVGVGGHSYGAFMVANLLSHSDLFAAGIARSGAYNRTLTPFGFQSEERSYWDSPETYYTMSPFMHADKMKTPLLLVHGEADNNSGTYPLQSERYFNALKGLGGPARLVMLPKESHGYRAKESILHLLWEQDRWLDMYVKNKEENEIKASSEIKQ